MRKLFVFFLLFASVSLYAQIEMVYVCTGANAYAFHKTNYCSGLSNCGGTIVYTDAATAQSVLYNYRKPCCRCYPNTFGCHDDLAVVYPGGASEGLGLAIIGIAAATVTVGVFLESHEICVHRVHSLYAGDGMDIMQDRAVGEVLRARGRGWSFGLRRNFNNKSALEYGYTTVTFFYRYEYGRAKTIMESEEYKRFIYLNYVFDVPFFTLPDRVGLSLGVQGVYSWRWLGTRFGFGALCGAQYWLTDRLKVDFRYTLNTQFRDAQIGLHFIYQKRSWLQRRRDKRMPSEE